MLGEGYNITELKKMSKSYFYKNYKGKIYDIDKVWEWLHPPKKKKQKEE